MRHTFSEVAAIPCPVFKCDCCKNDTSVDDETVGKLVTMATINIFYFVNSLFQKLLVISKFLNCKLLQSLKISVSLNEQQFRNKSKN